eukprot:UN18516
MNNEYAEEYEQQVPENQPEKYDEPEIIVEESAGEKTPALYEPEEELIQANEENIPPV